MAVSKAQIKATNKYNASKYDRLNIVIPKGRKHDIDAHAKAKGETVNSLVNTLLREDMGISEEEWKKQEGEG